MRIMHLSARTKKDDGFATSPFIDPTFGLPSPQIQSLCFPSKAVPPFHLSGEYNGRSLHACNDMLHEHRRHSREENDGNQRIDRPLLGISTIAVPYAAWYSEEASSLIDFRKRTGHVNRLDRFSMVDVTKRGSQARLGLSVLDSAHCPLLGWAIPLSCIGGRVENVTRT
ncbi:hypothetical protein BDN72DRAFT_192448 [Pluteus cervinus]|uniref:Uncharacterized protein n=1 Tax=Pluteus cervinus TaxID=181527 RepID=A0ACD3AIZ7_9AGAR|nr:hypothetical protein BDN72DRAFT_192448 [Pluteus cervinus]